MDIEKLMEDLKNLKRPTELFGRTDYLPVINADNLHDVEMVIRQHLLDEHDKEIGVLKAKVYAYESIIANSNFAPMIITESNKEKRKPCINNDGLPSDVLEQIYDTLDGFFAGELLDIAESEEE